MAEQTQNDIGTDLAKREILAGDALNIIRQITAQETIRGIIDNTPVPLIDGRKDWSALLSVGQQLRALDDSSRWGLGYLFLRVNKEFGFTGMEVFATELGYRKSTAYDLIQLIKEFDKPIEGLTYTHIREAMRSKDPQRWIGRALEEGYTATELRRKISQEEREIRKPEYSEDEFTELWKAHLISRDRLIRFLKSLGQYLDQCEYFDEVARKEIKVWW